MSYGMISPSDRSLPNRCISVTGFYLTGVSLKHFGMLPHRHEEVFHGSDSVNSDPCTIHCLRAVGEKYLENFTMDHYFFQVKERFAFMFNNEILSDVHFIVGRDMVQQRIPAHKFVLAVGSAVFDAMFNGTLATQADTVELPDVEPAAFLALLK